MKRKVLWSTVVWICAFWACCNAWAADAKVPKAVSPKPTVEFEPVLDGDEVVSDFVVQNAGQAELLIQNVRTS